MKVHELKTWPRYFEAVLSGEKTFELRRDDRGYAPGDALLLREWDRERGYTGRAIERNVAYVARDIPEFGLRNGFCILALHDPFK